MSEILSKLILDNSQFVGKIKESANEVLGFSKKTKDAANDISTGFTNAGSKTQELSNTTEASTQKQSQSWGRVGKAIGAVTAISAGLFKSMVDASPSLQAAFGEIKFMFEEVFMVLGEQLAPIIEEYVVPAVEQLTNFIMDLSPEIQTLISYVISATAIFGSLSSGASLLGGSITGLLGPIGLAIAAVVALYFAWKENFGGIRDTVTDLINYIKDGIENFINDHKDQMNRIVKQFKELWEILKPYVEIFVKYLIDDMALKIKWAFDQVVNTFNFIMNAIEGTMDIIIGIFTGDWDRAMEGFVAVFDNAVQYLRDTFAGIIDLFGNIFDNFSGGLVDIIDLLFGEGAGEKVGLFVDAIKQALNVVINLINDIIINNINNILDLLAAIIDEIPGVDKPTWKIEPLATFHSGGVIPGTPGQEVMIKALAGEVVYNPMRGQNASTFNNNRSMNVTNNITLKSPQFTDKRESRRLIKNLDIELRKSTQMYISGRT